MNTSSKPHRSGALVAGTVAALLASACCVGPLLLVMLGIGGAWASNLTVLEPLRPVFVGFTLVFLGIAFYRLYLIPTACAPGQACAAPLDRRRQRVIFWLVTIPLLTLLAFPWYAPIFY